MAFYDEENTWERRQERARINRETQKVVARAKTGLWTPAPRMVRAPPKLATIPIVKIFEKAFTWGKKVLGSRGPAASVVNWAADQVASIGISTGIAGATGLTVDQVHVALIQAANIMSPDLGTAINLGLTASDPGVEMILDEQVPEVRQLVVGSGTEGIFGGLAAQGMILLRAMSVAVYYKKRLLTVVSDSVADQMTAGMKREVWKDIRMRVGGS